VSSRREHVDRRLIVILAAWIAARFAIAVHVDDTASGVAEPQTKGVVSGTLLLASGPRPLTQVAGQFPSPTSRRSEAVDAGRRADGGRRDVHGEPQPRPLPGARDDCAY
jgi:hypothetical protein